MPTPPVISVGGRTKEKKKGGVDGSIVSLTHRHHLPTFSFFSPCDDPPALIFLAGDFRAGLLVLPLSADFLVSMSRYRPIQ